MSVNREDLTALLRNLHWKGEEKQIDDALPYGGMNNFQDFRDTMARLGYTSSPKKYVTGKNPDYYLPAVHIDGQGKAYFLMHPSDLMNLKNHTEVFSFQHAQISNENSVVSLRGELKRFTPLLGQILLLSFVIGVIVLAPIVYNRIVYDHIIASGSTYGMGIIVLGIFAALTAEILLRNYRGRQLALFGGRLDHYVSYSVFERLLFLPPMLTERASVSAQLARLRDFESVREFFTGPLATLFFELPLVMIYLVAMIIFTGWLALVPVALLFCYAILIGLMNAKLKERSKASAAASSQRQEFLLESVTKMKAIRLAGMEDVWQQRYRNMSAQASLSSFRSGFTAQTLETISYILMTLGGVATLAFGVYAVIEQALTVGGLIAGMMIIWRIIAPLQICCASITRLQQLVSSTKQVQRLLSVTPERNPYGIVPPRPNLKGNITFHRVSLRYGPDSEPALLGVSFEVKAGQIVAIKGNNGSGKSSILKLALGMYQPQGGSIRIDGIDIRQYDPITLRQTICYIPQFVDLYPGTLRENVTFAVPEATEEELKQALIDACAWEEVQNLPQGLDTIIEGENAYSISFLLKQRLNLARAYIKNSPIMLFDEASYSLGKQNDEAFMKKIASLRGRSTVMIVTHREDHMRMADQLLVLNKGELTHAGPPAQILTVLKGKK